MSSTANMDASVKKIGSRFARDEVTIEIPLQAALDLYFVFADSRKKCSSRLADELYFATRKGNANRVDEISITVRYNDRGWKTWLLKTCELRLSYLTDGNGNANGNGSTNVEDNVSEFAELIESL